MVQGLSVHPVYVDPMHRIILIEEQQASGKAALCDIAVRIRQFLDMSSQSDNENRNGTNSIKTSPSNVTVTSQYNSDLLRKHG